MGKYDMYLYKFTREGDEPILIQIACDDPEWVASLYEGYRSDEDIDQAEVTFVKWLIEQEYFAKFLEPHATLSWE